jgi:hypothetical protein
MFKRIICEDWTVVMPVIAFFFTATLFVYTSIRAIRLPKARREKLAGLALDEGTRDH